MRPTATLTLEFASESDARTVARAIAPDNGTHATCKAIGRRVQVVASADTPMGLLRTLDDLLECVRATGLA